MHLPLLLLLAVLQRGPVAGAGPDERSVDPGQPRNVLLVVLDDVGWTDVAPAVPTPNLSALMRRGTTFDRAYAPPNCSPSRFALLTGAWPVRGGFGNALGLSLVAEHSMAKDVPTLPHLLLGNGITTGLVGKWHLSAQGNGVLREGARLHGFAAWRAGTGGNVEGGSEDYGGAAPLGWERVDDGVRSREHAYNPEVQTDAALTWWGAASGPRLLVVSYNLAHAPFHDPPSHLLPAGRSAAPGARGRFEDMVQALDTELGRLLAGIDESDTTVVVVSDNGTPKQAVASGQNPQRVKTSVYEGGIRVPLVVAGAGVGRRGARVDEVVHVVDLAPTVAELLGVRAHEGFARDGVSLVELLRDPRARSPRPWAFCQVYSPNGGGPRTEDRKAIVLERFKLHRDGVSGEELLFDLAQDPGEARPLPIPFLPPASDAARALVRARELLASLGEL